MEVATNHGIADFARNRWIGLPRISSFADVHPCSSISIARKMWECTTEKIREKYGGKLPKAINRAIRAEIPGGNQALDKMTELAGARTSGWFDHQGQKTPEAKAYYKHKREVVGKMDAMVRKRWGIPLDMGKDDDDEMEVKPRRKKC